ncbi:MAG TPA: hypothetical protein VMH80_03165 [Bryobacteraceae bacterium]|nr:hypothetical protein [Bryobacteraceae bacterium]
MPAYQIHRLKETQRQQFRWAPHTSGLTIAKPKDYEPGNAVEASSPYALWLALRDQEHPLEVGDLVEGEDGNLRIFKYIGFEEARWYVPEAAPPPISPALEVT